MACVSELLLYVLYRFTTEKLAGRDVSRLMTSKGMIRLSKQSVETGFRP